MIPSISTLGDILSKNSQYIIPIFQRGYRWEQPQWEKYWASLAEIRRPEKTGNHFMGFLVFVPGVPLPGQDYSRFHLVDGQQRLTTSLLLMIALRNVARRAGESDLARRIHEKYIVHQLLDGKEVGRLVPKAQDGGTFAALVKSLPDSGRMADAVSFFERCVSAEVEADPVSLMRVLSAAAQRFEFMCATLEAESAYNIFKSLNSTGVPLGPSDLIRNFVFMHVRPDDQDAFEREKWAPLEALFADNTGRLDEDTFSRFFRDVLMMDGRYVQPKDTFATFESRYEATGFRPAELAEELLKKAKNYCAIAGRCSDVSAEVTDALQGLNLLESSTTYPLLLALFHYRAEGVVDSGQLARCIKMLQGFILRRFVCGESSRGYGQMFVRALARNEGDPVAALENYLLERGWPDDRRFMEAFVQFPLYKRGYAREVLLTIERSYGHKEQAALHAAQIEHVMPQTLRPEWNALLGENAARIHADWLHRPGNLTLSAYNQELGNQPFELKRARFSQSNVVMTRALGDQPTWGEDAIRARGELMAEAALNLWVGPKEPWQAKDESGEEEADGRLNRHDVRKKFWSGFLEHVRKTHPEVSSFDPRHYKAIRLKSGVPHVGFEIRHQLRPSEVAIDVYFWREASFPLWERFLLDQEDIDRLINDRWTFDRPQNDSHPRSMTISLSADAEDEDGWPSLYGWLGQKLALLYAQIAPRLREEMRDEASVIGDFEG
ncbi:DUF4268 domain-containing protein [Silanimonas sp.]|uniref:DUF4268 domain-containing protein n=1 Tax=Silanimonas sp. TaxID=1929290 RepID=UPI0022C5EDA3|nr:DUF4268 domain-containing protein [Silanimonas sp.]MCZ8167200.1 DUF4268 domain-containing protein [Silanimonas sp.]